MLVCAEHTGRPAMYRGVNSARYIYEIYFIAWRWPAQDMLRTASAAMGPQATLPGRCGGQWKGTFIRLTFHCRPCSL